MNTNVRNRNAVSRRSTSAAGSKLKRNIYNWSRKHQNEIEQYNDALKEKINEPLNLNSTQVIYNKYKKFYKELKNDERKKNTRHKRNIKLFLSKNHDIIQKHKNDTRLKLTTESTSDE